LLRRYLPKLDGEFAATAATTEQEIPPLGDLIENVDVAGTANAAHNPMQGVNNLPNQRQYPNMHFNAPPPQTPTGQAINTGLSVAALAVVCLQGYWSNPIFMWGCGGMIIHFILQIGNVNNL
jgi:hypothetical protein